MADSGLRICSSFVGIALPLFNKTGLTVNDLDGLSLATVQVRKGLMENLAARVQAEFGLTLPDGPRRSVAGAIAFAGIGPQTWLASAENGDDEFAQQLTLSLGDLAAVNDQSSGYAVMRLGGPHVREALGKLVLIDLHESSFPPHSVAVTSAAHIGVILWRLPDRADRTAVFEIAVFRSMARSFWDALVGSGAVRV